MTRSISGAACMAAGSFFMTDAVLAQEVRDSALAEITVTATKVEQPLSKVPISVTAFTQETMDVRAIRDVRDLVAQTPGVDLAQNTGSVGGYRVAVRGIDSTAGASTTATYIDETAIQARNAALNYSGTTFPQVFDLERVEVLRGPQGTLFGASAQGGAIRFITPAPSLTKFSGYGRLMATHIDHGDGSYEAGAAVGGPMVEDKLGFRVSADRKQIGGYIRRVSWQLADNHDNDTNKDRSDILRGSLLWQPVSGLSLMPSVYFQHRKVDDSASFWANLSAPEQHEFLSGAATAQPYDDRFVLPSFKAVADVGGLTLTSVTAYYDRTVRESRDQTNGNDRLEYGRAYLYPRLPGTPEIFSIMRAHTDQRDFTQEFRINNSDPDARLRWQTGLYYSRGNLHSDPHLETRHFNALYLYVTGQTVLEGKGSDNVDGIYNYVGDEHTKERSVAAFANVDYKVFERLTLTLGGRVAKNRLDFNVLERGPDYGVAGQQSAAGTLEGSPFTPRVALAFQANESNMFYASYAQGYRTGGVNKSMPNSCASDLATLGLASPRTYRPDTTDSYEIGAKNRLFEGRMQLEASVFLVKWQDIQQQIRLPCAYSLVGNTGAATSKGFDINLNVQPVDSLLLSAAIGRNTANYDSSIVVGVRPIVFDGQTLGQTPWTANLAGEYHFRIASREAYFRTQYNYRSRNDGPFNYQDPRMSQYDPTRFPNEATRQLDLRTGISLDNVEVSMFLENALDSTPVLDFTPAYAGAPLQTARTLPPRTWGVMATMRF